jgi:hypothetical protein
MLIDDIADYLEINGFGELTENLFTDSMPNDPEELVVLFSLPSQPFTMRSNDMYMSFQVRVRSKTRDSGISMVNGIRNLLDDGDKRITYLQNGRKIIVRPTAPPFLLEIDEMERFNYIFNFFVISVRD